MIRGLTTILVRYRLLVVGLTLLLTLFLGYHSANIVINSNIISSLPEDDPVAALYLETGREFGGNDMGMIVLRREYVFTNEVLEEIHRLTDSLMFMDGIASVTSLTHVMDIRSSAWGIEIGKLIDPYELPLGDAELQSLIHYTDSVEMYRGSLVSSDGTATVILFSLTEDADHQTTARAIRSMTGELNLQGEIYFGGLPMMMFDVNQLILKDVSTLVPLVFLVIGLILYLSFRSWRGVLLPIITAGIAVVWTLGLMSLTGYELTVISNIIPVVLLAIGSAYSIHVINSVNLHRREDPEMGLEKGLSSIAVPVILASVTTAVGFISFVFGAYLTMIRDFGIFTAIGTLLSLVLSLTLVPAVLSFGQRTEKNGSSGPGSLSVGAILPQRLLMPLIRGVIRYPGRVFLIWGILTVVFITGLFMIRTSINMTHYFKPDFPTRVAEDILQEKFGGSMPVFVIFEGDMQDPGLLQMMEQTALFMKGDPNVGVTQSVADLIARMNEVMGEGRRVPDERDRIEQLWFLLEGQEIMPQLVNGTLDRGIIQARFASIDTREMESFTARMNSYIDSHSADGYRIMLTGMPPVYVQLNNSLIRSQFSSLILAIVLVCLLVSLILRSIKGGVFATIPVVATILLLMGFMGLTGIAIDIATVLVASVALGLGIDYSIHTITGYSSGMRACNDPDTAMEEAILQRGSAILINVVSVSAGFLILLFSQIIPLQHFGLLVAVSMIGSGTGALTLLPVLLIMEQRRKDNIRKRGREPESFRIAPGEKRDIHDDNTN